MSASPWLRELARLLVAAQTKGSPAPEKPGEPKGGRRASDARPVRA